MVEDEEEEELEVESTGGMRLGELKLEEMAKGLVCFGVKIESLRELK